MFYRRILPVATGVAVLAGGYFSLNFSGSNTQYNGPRIHDHGLKNYSFVDSRKFELINVTILARHGARTPNYYVDSKFDTPDWSSGLGYVHLLPDFCYSTDIKELPAQTLIDEESIQEEYLEHNKNKCSYGQLTLVGQEQAIAFGRELRRIYMMGNKLLNQIFDENEILCRSTKFPRTFYTLKGILSGIYGVDSFDSCNRPIIYTMPIAMDILYPNPAACSVVGAFINAGTAEASKEADIMKMKCVLKRILGVDRLRYIDPNKPKSKMSNNSDRSKEKCRHKETEKEKETKEVKEESEAINNEYVPIYAVRDDLYSRQVHNFEVPSEFCRLTPEINRLSSQEILYEYLGGSDEWEERIAIIVSPTINFIKDNMNKVVGECLLNSSDGSCVSKLTDSITKKKGTMKMQLLSCHDTTLIPLMVCLRFYDGQWPVFMSNVIIELYKEKSTNNFFSRILCEGKVQNVKLSDKSCTLNDYAKQGLVPYDDLLALFDKYSFPDHKYGNSCDKILKLFKDRKPITKDQYV